MDTENIPKLTVAQLDAINKAVTAHRPACLIDSSTSANKVCLAAISRRGDTLGRWRLELSDSGMLLQVIIDDVQYAEILPNEFPDRFDRVLGGLELWVKSMNAEELKVVLRDIPTLGHLMPEHIIDPATYLPLGGVSTR